MNFKKYFILLILSVLSVSPVLTKMMQIFPEYELGWLDKEVEKVCRDYLASKGFEFKKIGLSKLKKSFSLSGPLPAPRFDLNSGTFEFDDGADGFWKNLDAYAFAILEKNAIVLSPQMIASIKYSLQQTGQLTIYDKYVLLHEVGHLFPYGVDYEKACEKGADRLFPFFVVAGSLVFEVIIGAIALDMVNHFKASPSTVSFVENGWLVMLGATSVAAVVSLIPFLYNVSESQKVTDTFEKTKLNYLNPQFKGHMATVLEERDADVFAFNHFSQSELEEYALVYFQEQETVVPEVFIEREYLTEFERYALVKSLLNNKTIAS